VHCSFLHSRGGGLREVLSSFARSSWQEHIRQYQAYLFRERKLSAGTIEGRTGALRFLFVKTLRRPYLPDHIPFPKRQRRLPTILDQQEVARLIDSAVNLMHRAMLMMLYATGLRSADPRNLCITSNRIGSWCSISTETKPITVSVRLAVGRPCLPRIVRNLLEA
jgi:integrase